jgi:GTP-binding protein
LIEGYLRRTETLAGVVLLLDIRRDPSEDDMSMLDFLADVGVPTIVVLTKTDKVGRVQAEERSNEIMARLSLSRDQTIPFSSSTGEGRGELAEALVALVASAGKTET